MHTQVRDDYGKDFLRLPGGRWSVWRCCALRSAGFPARLVDKLADPVLARTADECLPQRTGQQRRDPRAIARYEAEFDAAADRATAATAELAQDDRFREALAWQNRTFLATCVDRDAQRPRRDSGVRHREAAIASYLQRYATKNDSIGFFGPIGWASWQPAGPAATVIPGPALLARRTVYFESWAIDAVGRAFAERPEILPGVPPRRVPANYVRDGVVHFPVGRPVRLTPQDAARLTNELAEAFVQEQSETSAVVSTSAALRERIKVLGPTARIISEAVSPNSKDGLPHTVVLLLATLLGAAAGAGSGLTRTAFDRRVRTAQQLDALTSVECFGYVPKGKLGKGSRTWRGGPGDLTSIVARSVL